MITAPSSLTNEQMASWEHFYSRILILDDRAWERRLDERRIHAWLSNFDGETGASVALEQLHALYLLSQYMYFGSREVRVLLQALYREQFLLPLASEIRPTADTPLAFCAQLEEELKATRFLGVGNPSESGVHLLYFFRQENGLSKSSFLDTAQLYQISSDPQTGARIRTPRYPKIRRYVFIDDICGSGETAERYAKDLLPELIESQPDVQLHYLSLFATPIGMDRIRSNTPFGHRCRAVYELDDSYKFCSPTSRYLKGLPTGIHRFLLIALADAYGKKLWPTNALGFDDGQLLMGFSHNTPDNTLPIIWCDRENGGQCGWHPIFKRYPKYVPS